MILVTGASGLLGATFCALAHKRLGKVTGVYHGHPVRPDGWELVQADLREAGAAEALVERFRPSWIVHCAAQTNVDLCESQPREAERTNVLMTRLLAQAAARAGARLLFLSTDGVFDGAAGGYTEDSRPAPLNAYGRGKLAAEQAVSQTLKDGLIVRTNIYGWNARKGKLSLAEWVLDRLERGQRVPGFHDAIFSPILVNHLSEVLLDMMERKLTGLFHAAGGQACSKRDFAVKLAEVFGLDAGLVDSISVADGPLTAPRPRNASLDSRKAARALQRAMPDLESGLKDFKALRESGFAQALKG